MSVEQRDVIDFVARDPKTAETLLVMVEVRDWNSSPIAIQQLETNQANGSGDICSRALQNFIQSVRLSERCFRGFRAMKSFAGRATYCHNCRVMKYAAGCGNQCSVTGRLIPSSGR